MDRWLLYIINRDMDYLAYAFIEKYFIDTEDPEDRPDFWYVGMDRSQWLNDTLCVADSYFFRIEHMFTALWYNIPAETLFAWYDWWEEHKDWDWYPTLENYYLHPELFEEWKSTENTEDSVENTTQIQKQQ